MWVIRLPQTKHTHTIFLFLDEASFFQISCGHLAIVCHKTKMRMTQNSSVSNCLIWCSFRFSLFSLLSSLFSIFRFFDLKLQAPFFSSKFELKLQAPVVVGCARTTKFAQQDQLICYDDDDVAVAVTVAVVATPNRTSWSVIMTNRHTAIVFVDTWLANQQTVSLNFWVVFFGLIPTFFGQRFTSNMSKRRQIWSLPAQQKICFMMFWGCFGGHLETVIVFFHRTFQRQNLHCTVLSSHLSGSSTNCLESEPSGSPLFSWD